MSVEHYPINAGPDDEDDFRVCACGYDLYGVAACPDTPADACGCPAYTNGTEHLPGLCEPPVDPPRSTT